MSPERTGASVDLARLRVEVAEDRAAMSRCLDDVRSGLGHWGTPGPEPEWMALVAVGLHGWYTGLETALERVARAIDQSVPTGDSWHRNLLSQCTADVPPIRPAVLRNGEPCDSSVRQDPSLSCIRYSMTWPTPLWIV